MNWFSYICIEQTEEKTEYPSCNRRVSLLLYKQIFLYVRLPQLLPPPTHSFRTYYMDLDGMDLVLWIPSLGSFRLFCSSSLFSFDVSTFRKFGRLKLSSRKVMNQF